MTNLSNLTRDQRQRYDLLTISYNRRTYYQTLRVGYHDGTVRHSLTPYGAIVDEAVHGPIIWHDLIDMIEVDTGDAVYMEVPSNEWH